MAVEEDKLRKASLEREFQSFGVMTKKGLFQIAICLMWKHLKQNLQS